MIVFFFLLDPRAQRAMVANRGEPGWSDVNGPAMRKRGTRWKCVHGGPSLSPSYKWATINPTWNEGARRYWLLIGLSQTCSQYFTWEEESGFLSASRDGNRHVTLGKADKNWPVNLFPKCKLLRNSRDQLVLFLQFDFFIQQVLNPSVWQASF